MAFVRAADSVAANGPDSLIWWDWVDRHTDEIRSALIEHVALTAAAVGVACAVAVPAALLAHRHRRTRAPLFAAMGVLYTIPTLAFFFLLGPFTGYLTLRTTVTVLVAYTVLTLTRSIVLGLDGVPDHARDAAAGMGYRPWQVLARVELPLALPSIIAGLRVATVSTIGLVTVASVIGRGGLGQLIEDGMARRFSTPVMVGAGLSVALAVTADLLLCAVQRLATPWSRR